MIDVKTHTVIATIPVGNNLFIFKRSIFTRDGKLVYVTNQSPPAVYVIDVKTHSVIALFPGILTFTQDGKLADVVD
ncbi:hypothetical protein [Bacillus sp. SM2101]|uniref:hypothetical protein n=1 Tax=Bacillus sp. SM2101 TaxID=2805366 RepID=UPI003323B9DD